MKQKHRFIALFLSLCLLLAMIPIDSMSAVFAVNGAMQGDGTQANPYQIADAADLKAFAEIVNSTNPTVHAVLTNHIDLNPGITFDENGVATGGTPEQWTPIGSESSYIGTFDGNGFEISGVYSTKEADFITPSLFASVGETGVVKNVGLRNSYIDNASSGFSGMIGSNKGTVENCYNAGTVGGVYFVGGVVGNNTGTVANCYNTGLINALDRVGGVVGNNTGTVINCYNTGTFSDDSYNIGGVVGLNGGTVSNCYNTGTISDSSYNIGGVVGNNSGTVTHCYNAGAISGGSNAVGGVVGVNGGAVSNCHNTGVISDGTDYIGGIVGYSSGTVANSYNAGAISDDGSKVGGIIGVIEAGGSIKNCYNTGSLSGRIDIGGIVGAFIDGGGAVKNCYNTGSLSGLNDIGGIAGNDTGGTFENCYYLNSCGAAGVGTSAGKADMQSANFANALNKAGDIIWVFDRNVNDGYPVFIWQSSMLAGAGTQEFPYQIANAENLIMFRDLVNDGETGAWAVLTADIDMTDKTWTGIATNGAYTGTFDGQGFEIVNLTGSEGLFGKNSGIIKNVQVTNADIRREGGNLGVIAGANTGTVSGCATSGRVEGRGSESWSIGGIAGHNDGGTIIACISSCTAVSNANSQTHGGIVGSNHESGIVTGCAYTGDMTKKQVEGDGTYGNKTDVYYKDTVGNWHKVSGSGSTSTADCTAQEAVSVVNQHVEENGGYFLLTEEGGLIPDIMPGTGTEKSPYLIYTAEQLKEFAEKVNGGEYGAWAKLMANIVLNEGDLSGWDGVGTPTWEQWMPIGTNDNISPYTGTFDGNGKTISGLYINSVEDSQGLFGCVDKDGVVKNVGVIKSYIYTTGRFSGSIAGQNRGTIDNCYSSGNRIEAERYTGGVVGSSNGGTILNCYNTGSVTGNEQYTGGVIGSSSSSTVSNCYNTGSVTGNEQYTGGVIGSSSSNSTVSNCYNTGSVAGTEWDTGGVVGSSNGGTISSCFNAGNVTGGERATGGIAGRVSSVIVRGCYNTGDVTGQSDVGGIVGQNVYDTVENCYSIGIITGTSNVGGAVGSNTYGTVANCYYLQGMAENGIGSGAGSVESKNADEMKTVAFAAQLSDDNVVWVSDSSLNDGYPVFAWQSSVLPGSGTQEIPYEITDIDDLKTFRDLVNNGEYGACAILRDNIDLNPGILFQADGSYTGGEPDQWTPIGTSDFYTGIFDGNGKTISGLYINSANNYMGLFGGIDAGGVVKNVGIANSYISSSTGALNTYAGSIAGYHLGKIENCYNSGTVDNGYYVGGIVGYNGGTITNCYNNGDIKGKRFAGGIASSQIFDGAITNCFNIGSVSGNSGETGGIVGESSATVANCYYLNTCGAGGEGMSLTLVQIEDAGENGLLAKLRAGGNEAAWNPELSATGTWEYSKPLIQPVFSWQNIVAPDAPAYTVTIPETVNVNDETFLISASVNALPAAQQVQVTVSQDETFEMSLAGDSAETLNYKLTFEDIQIDKGGALFKTGNTAPNTMVSANITVTPDTPKYAGVYTDTVTFTVAVADVQ